MTSPGVAMILAAGFGTRMGRLTANRPKPLLRVGGVTLLDRTLDLAATAGVSRAVINLHYLGDQIRRSQETRRAPSVIFSLEEEILETGGGVARALPLLGAAPFFTANADAVWPGGDPFSELAAAWRPNDMGALLHLAPVSVAVAYTRAGDFDLDAAGRLVRRGEATTAPYVFTGAQIIAPDAFEDAPAGAFSLNVIWDRLLARGRLFGVVGSGGWVDVGTPEGLAAAEAEMASCP